VVGLEVYVNSVYINSETIPPYLFNLGIDPLQPQSISAYHTPFPYNTTWLEDLNQRYDQSDRIMVFSSELHANSIEGLLTLDREKIELHLCGVINQEFKHAKTYRWMDWFQWSSQFYRKNPTILNRLRPFDTKPRSFDILLGCQRPNRDYIFNYIVEQGLMQQVIMTYFQRWNIDLRTTDQFIPETEGLEYIQAPNGTVHQVLYYGERMTLSQVVPIEIYNQTAYTLVAETNGLNHFNFYTEKIVKPILARRLFVTIAGQHYLRNLRAMGFKTFDGVIDETYDSVEDPQTRWQMAMQQVQLLCNRPQDQIINQITEIVDHNYQVMINTNWHLIDYAKVGPTTTA
jgi:hypothetical protein